MRLNLKQYIDNELENEYYTRTEINSLIDDLNTLLATNLAEMGVTCSSSDGSFNLADNILDISPSIGGIDVITSLSCLTDEESYAIGDTVTVTGVLEADKDDTSVTNVDLEGYLKGATIKVYEGNTLKSTCVTNQNGEYTCTYTVETVGDISIHSVFEGTDDYESATSENMNITTRSLTLTSAKNILSYVDNDSTVLTATLIDTVPTGQTVQLFDSDDSLVGVMTDNNDGTYSYTITSNGSGDRVFYAKSGSLSSETYSIEDCVKYDTTEYTKSYSSTKFETIESVDASSDVSISLDLKTTTYNYSCVFGIVYNSESDQIGFGTTDTTGRIYRTLNSVHNHSYYSGFNSNNVYYNLRFERTGTTLKLYLNDNLIDTITNNEISSFKYLNFGSWSNKTIYYKNLKIKPL